MSFRESLRAVGVRPLIKHRVFAPYDHAHNARIDDERYHQRSMTESVNSSLKRSHGSALRARDWFQQFREIGAHYWHSQHRTGYRAVNTTNIRGFN
jgi:IS5 family transposase